MKVLRSIESNLLEQLIDRPDLIIAQSIDIQLALAQDIQTPRSILQILVDRGEPKIAEIAKLHVNYAGELTTDGRVEINTIFQTTYLGQNDRLAVELLKLGGVPAEFLSEWVPANVLIQALKNPHLSTIDRVKFLDLLAKSDNLAPRLEVAESIDTPAAVLGQLLGDIELAVRLTTQHHPNCPIDIGELIDSQQSIASNWDTDPAELAISAKSRWSWIRLKVAQNPSSSVETLRQLALDPIYQIQLAVANNPHTPADALATLSAIFTMNVPTAIESCIAANPNANAETLLKLLATQEGVIWARQSVPVEVMEKLLNDAIDRDPIKGIQSVCYQLLRYRNVPESILDRLSNCDVDELRSYLSTKNQFIISQIPDERLNDETNYLTQVAEHPNVSVKILEKLAKLPNPNVQLAVAKNILTPLTLKLELLENLCEVDDIEQSIQLKIARDSNTPVQILTRMAENESHENKLKRLIRLSLASKLGENTMTEVIDRIIVPAGLSVNIDRWMDLIITPDLWLVITTDMQSWWIEADRWIDRIAISLKNLLVGLSDDTIKQVANIFYDSVGSLAESVLSYPHFRSLAVALVGNSNLDSSSREILTARLLKKYPGYDREQNLDVYSTLIYNSQIPISDRRKYLELLMERGGSSKLESIAANPLTPIEFLPSLFAKGGSVQQYIGKNPNAPIDFLTELSKHNNSYTLDGVVKNPSVPVDILIEMANRLIADPGFENNNNNVQGILEIIQKNAKFPALESYRSKMKIEERQKNKQAHEILSRRLNSPYSLTQVLKTGDRNAKFTVARNPNTPLHILTQLAKDPDESIRMVLIDCQHLPVSVRLMLTEDPSENVRYGLARKHTYQDTPVEVLERLVDDESAKVRAMVAANSCTPVVNLRQLANDAEYEVKKSLVSNQNTPVEILERLGLQEGIFDVRNPNTPGTVLDRAVKMKQAGQDENNRRRRRRSDNFTENNSEDLARYHQNIMKIDLEDLLKHPVKGSQMPAETLAELANTTNSSARYLVAFHPNTPANTLAKLAYDDYSPVRAGVAENPNTPPEILLVLLRREKEHYLDQNYYGTICHNIARRANIPSELLFELARNESERIRQSIVHRPELPLSLLEWLVENEQNETVLRSLASCHDLTSNLLDRLAENSNPQVLAAIIYSPNLTSQLWRKLVENESIEVRSAIASSPLTPSDIIELLATDREAEVREKLAININTPANILDRLATDNELNVRMAIALNPSTSIDTLERLAADEKIEVRRAVSRNSQTSQTIKDKLRDLLPQSIAQSRSTTLSSLPRIYNPQTDDLPTILSEYSQSDNIFVRLITLRHPLTPIDILAQGMRSSEWFDRYAVADNPATPIELRQQLTQDSNRIVRAISISNL